MSWVGSDEEGRVVGRIKFSLEDVTSVEQNFSSRLRFVQIEEAKQWEAMKFSSFSSTPPWANIYMAFNAFTCARSVYIAAGDSGGVHELKAPLTRRTYQSGEIVFRQFSRLTLRSRACGSVWATARNARKEML